MDEKVDFEVWERKGNMGRVCCDGFDHRNFSLDGLERAVGLTYQLFFLVMASVISTVDFFVGLAKYRQKQNWVTKLLMKWRHYS